MSKDWSVAEVDSFPNCDICHKHEAKYDGAYLAIGNPWAFMCESCWATYGVGRLGIGIGQRLVLAQKS